MVCIRGTFDRFRFSPEMNVVVFLLFPLLLVGAVLYRTSAFVQDRRCARMFRLCLDSCVLLVLAYFLWFAAAFLLFAMGAIVPD